MAKRIYDGFSIADRRAYLDAVSVKWFEPTQHYINTSPAMQAIRERVAIELAQALIDGVK